MSGSVLEKAADLAHARPGAQALSPGAAIFRGRTA